MTRVYVALTRADLACLAADGELRPAPAFAVTPALRAAYRPAGVEDEEELEYVAMTVAARASLTRLSWDDAQDRRRVVVAADTDVLSFRRGGETVHPAQVELEGPVPLAAVASIHVDTADVRDLVDAAVRALVDTAAGDQSALMTLDALDREDLAWFATQELADVLSPDLAPGDG